MCLYCTNQNQGSLQYLFPTKYESLCRVRTGFQMWVPINWNAEKWFKGKSMGEIII